LNRVLKGTALQAGSKIHRKPLKIHSAVWGDFHEVSRAKGPKRQLKNSLSGDVLKGHDFSRADKFFIFVIPSGL